MDEKLRQIEALAIAQGLLPNQRKCPKCGDVLTSKHNYDMKQCKCGYLSIDGGNNLRVIVSEL